MIIPLHKFPVAIDFTPFMRLLEEKYGFNYRDMAGKFSQESHDESRRAKSLWMSENGFAGKEYVLETPDGSNVDWAEDSSEMALRKVINTMYREVEHKIEKRPYQDVWHWLLDHDFVELNRGGVNLLSLADIEGEYYPEYVRIVLRAIKKEVEDHQAFDGEFVSFYVDW